MPPESVKVLNAFRRIYANGHVAVQRIRYQRQMRRPGKKIPLDKQIHFRKFHAETRMCVIPADDFQFGMVALQTCVNRVPCFLRESDMCAPFASGGTGNHHVNVYKKSLIILTNVAGKDAANFRL